MSTKEAHGIQWNSVTRQFRLLNPISNDIYNLRSAIVFFSLKFIRLADLPALFLLTLSWNTTNENPSTVNLSRAIN